MICLWKIPDDYANHLLGEYDRDQGPDRFGIKQGKPLDVVPDQPPRFRFSASVSELREVDDLGNNALVPLVTPGCRPNPRRRLPRRHSVNSGSGIVQ